MDKKLLYYMWLGAVMGAGNPTPKILLEHYKDIEKIYKASYDDYKALGITEKNCAKLCEKSLDDAKRYYEYCVKEHIGLICYDNEYYPERLKCILTPPPVLYYRGRIEMLDDHPCFALVGTRSCSEKGVRYSYRLGYKAAARGAVVVNGLAKGCDAAAITGALDADGYAVGVLGCGIDTIYPPENKALFERLSRRGLIISEFPPFTKPEGRNFPVRNRVMSGLTLGTVVLEADAGSGALITAATAAEQGRKRYAIPGDINDPLYEGPLSVIKDGGKPVTDADDFVSEYELMFPHRINVKTSIDIPGHSEDAWVRTAFNDTEIAPDNNEGSRTLPKPAKSSLWNKKKQGSAKTSKTSKTADNNADKVLTSNVSDTKNTKDNEKKPISAENKQTSDYSALSAPERMIMELFDVYEILSPDEISAKGLKVDDVLSSLTILEIYGYLKALPGGRFQKIN